MKHEEYLNNLEHMNMLTILMNKLYNVIINIKKNNKWIKDENKKLL